MLQLAGTHPEHHCRPRPPRLPTPRSLPGRRMNKESFPELTGRPLGQLKVASTLLIETRVPLVIRVGRCGVRAETTICSPYTSTTTVCFAEFASPGGHHTRPAKRTREVQYNACELGQPVFLKLTGEGRHPQRWLSCCVATGRNLFAPVALRRAGRPLLLGQRGRLIN
jgi:hypothetical protein